MRQLATLGSLSLLSPDTENLTDKTKKALGCLQAEIVKEYNGSKGTYNLVSAYRSAAYQNHLYEVWDKYQKVKTWRVGKCEKIRKNVVEELKHHGINERPCSAGANCPHPKGIAFDMVVNLPQGRDLNKLADGCNLKRHGSTHFELK